jgi:hypothetical protein
MPGFWAVVKRVGVGLVTSAFDGPCRQQTGRLRPSSPVGDNCRWFAFENGRDLSARASNRKYRMTCDSVTGRFPSVFSTAEAYRRTHRGNHFLSFLPNFASCSRPQNLLTVILRLPEKDDLPPSRAFCALSPACQPLDCRARTSGIKSLITPDNPADNRVIPGPSPG